jgi:anti-sigma factor RsiW
MSRQLYNDQTLTQYLLGSLSEEETERLDEASLTDDEVAEALWAVEQDLVDAYAQGELSEAESAQFKSYYLASPRRREKAAFAQAFRAHAEKSLAARQAAEAHSVVAAEVAPRRKGESRFFPWRGFSARRSVWQWCAAAAASALLVAGSWLVFERVRTRQQPAQTQTRLDATRPLERESQKESENRQADSAQTTEGRTRGERGRLAPERTQREQQHTSGQPRAAEEQRAASQRQEAAGTSRIAFFVLTPQMRGAGLAQTISIPPQTARVALRLKLEPNEFSTYRIALLDAAAGRTLWRSGRLKARTAGDEQVLNLSFRTRLFKPQARYVLRVSGGAAEIVDDYPFRVVR